MYLITFLYAKKMSALNYALTGLTHNILYYRFERPSDHRTGEFELLSITYVTVSTICLIKRFYYMNHDGSIGVSALKISQY